MPDETRAADAVTVFWLLTGFSTVIAEFGWCVLRLLPALFDDRERWLALLTVVFGIAFLSGAVTLALTPIAIRTRKTRPPRSIVVAAVIIGCLPVALLAVSYVID
jgi:hypothetical protein